MQKLVGFSGRKQSGKSSSAAFIHGYVLVNTGVYDDFVLDDNGRLLVLSNFSDDGEEYSLLDLDRKDELFCKVAAAKIWPYVKAYSFADELKSIAIRVFGLTTEQCYGTNEQKDSATQIRWADIAKLLPPATVGALKKEGKLDGFLTGREFLQVFGSDICRIVCGNCWVNALFNKIREENVPLAVINDVRFPNEADGCLAENGKVIRLSRNIYHDNHASETALDQYERFSYTLDNRELTLQEKTEKLFKILRGWDYL